MSPALQNGLKLCTYGSVSLGAAASGFVFLSLPVGIILKITGVSLTILGTFGIQTLRNSAPEVIQTNEDLNHMVQEIHNQMTYKSMAFNAALIGLISTCYLLTIGGI